MTAISHRVMLCWCRCRESASSKWLFFIFSSVLFCLSDPFYCLSWIVSNLSSYSLFNHYITKTLTEWERSDIQRGMQFLFQYEYVSRISVKQFSFFDSYLEGTSSKFSYVESVIYLKSHQVKGTGELWFDNNRDRYVEYIK